MTKTFNELLEALMLQFPQNAGQNSFKMTKPAFQSSPASVVSFEHEKTQRDFSPFKSKHDTYVNHLKSSIRNFRYKLAEAEMYRKKGHEDLAQDAEKEANMHSEHFFNMLPDYISHHESNPEHSGKINDYATHHDLLNAATDMTELTPVGDTEGYALRVAHEKRLKNYIDNEGK